MTSFPAAPPDVARLLRTLPSDVQTLVHTVRRLVFATLPGVDESADTKARILGYSYAPGYRGMVATIILSKKGTKLGIVRGVELRDPAGLLKGEGKVHRHIPFTLPSEVERPAVKTLLKAALAAWKMRTALA